MSDTEFNWFTELDNAINTEPTFTRCKYLSDMAKEWVTCACGELCKKLKRRRGGAPEDPFLYNYGTEFNYAIKQRDWNYAKLVLEQIEKRTIELLNELALNQEQESKAITLKTEPIKIFNRIKTD